MPRRSFLQKLLIVFIVSYAFIQSLPDYTRSRSQHFDIPEYQQTMHNFTITHSDRSGQPTHVLRAMQLQTDIDNQTRMEDVSLSVFNPENETIIIANKGLVESDQSIYLKGDVRITRNNLQDTRSILIETDELHHDPATGISQTEAEVDLTTPEGHINATGMVIDNETRQMQLKQNVIGRYEAP